MSDKVESKSERIDYDYVIVDDIPEFDISPTILELIRRLDFLHESCKGVANRRMESRLRRTSDLRSVNSSLAIEGNGLDILRMRDVINGRTVEGPFDEILETRNAIRAYDEVRDADLWSVDDFLRIHGTMMFGCVEQEGFRTHGVCIAEGDGRVVYVAPGHDQVEPMVRRLFDWCRDSDYPAPVTAAIAHYYIESVHPFPDGNGRIGRLWHSEVLHRWDPVFDLVPIETKIRGSQDEYYAVLERCQHHERQDCTGFIEFCLAMNVGSLTDVLHLKDPRMSRLMDAMGPDPMTSTEIMGRMGMRHKPYFMANYMRPAIEWGLVSMTEPGSPHSRYQRYRRMFLRDWRDGAFRMAPLRPVPVIRDSPLSQAGRRSLPRRRRATGPCAPRPSWISGLRARCRRMPGWKSTREDFRTLRAGSVTSSFKEMRKHVRGGKGPEP